MLLGLVISGAVLILSFGLASAQDGGEETPEYVGMRTCFACHRDIGDVHLQSPHVLTMQEASPDTILGDLAQETDALTITFPGEEEARTLTADDIAFTLGTGRFVQRYVTEITSEDASSYMVLPVQWNTVQQAWEPYVRSDEWPSPDYDFTTNCAGCHTTGLKLDASTWIDTGVQCEACHGPGSVHLRSIQSSGGPSTPEGLAAIRASIVVSPDPQTCGQCHSQGTNPDGLPFPTGYVPGEELLTEDMFTLVAPDDEAHWLASGHAADKYMQFNETLLSAHPNALDTLRGSEFAQDECLICHSTDYQWNQALIEQHASGERQGDAPAALTLESAQLGVTCISCHETHPAPVAEGEEPPATILTSADARYALCVTCHQDTDVTGIIHSAVRQMYEGETLIEQVEGVPSAHYTAENGPTCTTCHMPSIDVGAGQRNSHTFKPILPGSALEIEGLQDTCSACHASQVNAVGLQAFIDDIQSGTQARIDAAYAAMTDASPDWIGSALDFVEGDGSLGIHNYGYSDALLDAVEVELGLVEPIKLPTMEAPEAEPDAETPAENVTTTPEASETSPAEATPSPENADEDAEATE